MATIELRRAGPLLLEIWIDEGFIASWHTADIPEYSEGTIRRMLEKTYEAGQRDMKKETREFLLG